MCVGHFWPASSSVGGQARFVICCLILALGRRRERRSFGRNKVQYRALGFQVLKTEHFDIYFYPDERAGVEISARLAERWYVRLPQLCATR